ncbi:hypothetical protein BDZ88DRAFT_468668 [Geranomyces variabilis]|nr:hypothetical protein BDZ88DRAFT_468668 [Geranomyces variabilis]
MTQWLYVLRYVPVTIGDVVYDWHRSALQQIKDAPTFRPWPWATPEGTSCNRFQSVVDLSAAAEPQAVRQWWKENPETEYESSDDESDLDGVPKAPKAITLKGLGKVVAGNDSLTTKHKCKSGKITRSIRFLSIKGLFRVAGSVATDRAQELCDWAADLCAPSVQTVTTVGKSLSLFTAGIPGIYFLLVGKLGDLPDHRREFGNYPGATLTVKGLMITERSELSTAENAIHAWLHGAGEKVEPKARRQLKDGSTNDVHK